MMICPPPHCVMYHVIMAGNIACKMLQFAKLLIADVRFDLKSNWIFKSQERIKIQVSDKTRHIL